MNKEIKRKYSFNKINFLLKNICIIDRFLIIIMIILFIQLVITIYVPKMDTDFEARKIDLVLRTTLSSIFGYFLSSNFMRNSRGAKFSINNTKKEDMTRSENVKDFNTLLEKEEYYKFSQIFIVGAIAIVSIIILVVARNIGIPYNLDTVSALSQLRDLVGGSIGFLIGNPINLKKE